MEASAKGKKCDKKSHKPLSHEIVPILRFFEIKTIILRLIKGSHMNISANESRVRCGVPTIVFNKNPVVAADAISLLSGVNFGSVEKVIAALHILTRASTELPQFAGTDAQTLVMLSNVPTHRVIVGDLADTRRAVNTLQACEAIVDSGKFTDLDDVLKLRGRFG